MNVTKHVSRPIDYRTRISDDDDDYSNLRRYRNVVGKVIF